MNEKMKNEIKEKTLKALDENDLENVAGGKELSEDAKFGLSFAGSILGVAALISLAFIPDFIDIDRRRKEKKEIAKAQKELEEKFNESGGTWTPFPPPEYVSNYNDTQEGSKI